MTWRKTLLLGLVFGVTGLAYAAWRGRQERDLARRQRLLDVDDWCTCTETHTCEGHRG